MITKTGYLLQDAMRKRIQTGTYHLVSATGAIYRKSVIAHVSCPDAVTVHETTYVGEIALIKFLKKSKFCTVTTTAFVPKDVAIKMNLPLYRILNELNDM